MAASALALCPVPVEPCDFKNECHPRFEQTTPSDDTLLESARMGDGAAFGRLIERHYQFCMAKACSVLRNRGDAEDEVQNACAKAWKYLWQYKGEGSFGGWLSRIVSNQCLMRLRERKNVRMVSVDEVLDSDGSFRLEVIDQRALPEEAVGNDEVSRVLINEINRVPYLLREALIMRDLRDLNMRDIAAHLGISIPAAKSRLMRARMELKQRLAKQLGDRGSGMLLRKSCQRRAAYVRAS